MITNTSNLNTASKKLWYADDGNAEVEVFAINSKAAAQEYVDGGGFRNISETVFITVNVWKGLDKDNERIDEDVYVIPINPKEPKCFEDKHFWKQSSVRGDGCGVIVIEECSNCNCIMTTVTCAQNPATGEQGFRSVAYSVDESL